MNGTGSIPGRPVLVEKSLEGPVPIGLAVPDGHRCARTLIGSSETMVDR